MDAYKTVWERCRAELTERRSRFIATAERVETREQATAFINEIKAEFPDARHHVYAFALKEGGYNKHSDDGEPSGTGGIPVLNVINGAGLLDTAVVVTRYFGGVLLGTGGLSRAYSDAAALALKNAVKAEKRPITVYETECDYRVYGQISSLTFEGTEMTAGSFTEKVCLRFEVPSQKVNAFEKRWSELLSGAPLPQKTAEILKVCKIF